MRRAGLWRWRKSPRESLRARETRFHSITEPYCFFHPRDLFVCCIIQNDDDDDGIRQYSRMSTFERRGTAEANRETGQINNETPTTVPFLQPCHQLIRLLAFGYVLRSYGLAKQNGEKKSLNFNGLATYHLCPDFWILSSWAKKKRETNGANVMVVKP